MNKRKIFLQMIDLAVMLAALAAAAAICFGYRVLAPVSGELLAKSIVMVACLFGMRCLFRLYYNIWRYANVSVYLRIILSDVVGFVLYLLLDHIVLKAEAGHAFAILSIALIVLLTLSSRFFYQQLHAQMNARKEQATGTHNRVNIAIVGAGNVGTALAEELLRNPRSRYQPFCFIDKDDNKIGSRILGVPIYREDEDIVGKLKSLPVQEIVIAIPDADADTKAGLYERYRATGCPVKLYDYLGVENGVAEKRVLREFNIEDLLFRNSIHLENEVTDHFYANKTVLVTGGGGSIGSELCRQIAKQGPRQLVIFDIYENNAYEIQQELLDKYGTDLNLEVVIGSVRDEEKLESVFAAYRPEVVIHAAAHKHVPLMESSPAEAIKNNVLGTYHTANMAERYGVSKFLLISSDKAVNPTNIMGASKRLCEMIVQSRKDSETDFCAVRFGNVLGSNGSVIPLFCKQIAKGGPVTITDKRIIRYFMTIPEAVQLVLEAGAMADSGELFVLDMGKPVKILDLAENLIRLSGFVPYEEIDIVEVGLRPGEKLFEELLINSEDMQTTKSKKIFVERDKPLSRDCIEEKLSLLQKALSGSREEIFAAFRETVPTYHPAGWTEPKIQVSVKGEQV